MKFPVSQLKSHDLELLFKNSSLLERHFFSRKVPSSPDFNFSSKEKGQQDSYPESLSKANESSVEKS